MKNLFLFAIVLTFVSCNSNSSSNWSKDEMDLCVSGMSVGMLSEPGATEALEAMGENMDDVTNCLCQKLSKEHASFAEAGAKLATMSEKDAVIMLMPCFSESTQKLMQLGIDQM
tara:strand:- start:1008 stop:1349 length:342 start_codon:yes stop_codon:yes gene_type:complete